MTLQRRSSLLIYTALVAGLCSLAASGYAQVPESVRWSASAVHGANKEEFLVRLDAEIPKGWHVYGITQLQGGTFPLVIRIEPGASYELTDKPRGTAPQRRHDASFDLDTELYTDSLKLNVPVRATDSGADANVPLTVRFQMCGDTTCLPPKTVHLLAKPSL